MPEMRRAGAVMQPQGPAAFHSRRPLPAHNGGGVNRAKTSPYMVRKRVSWPHAWYLLCDNNNKHVLWPKQHRAYASNRCKCSWRTAVQKRNSLTFRQFRETREFVKLICIAKCHIKSHTTNFVDFSIIGLPSQIEANVYDASTVLHYWLNRGKWFSIIRLYIATILFCESCVLLLDTRAVLILKGLFGQVLQVYLLSCAIL